MNDLKEFFKSLDIKPKNLDLYQRAFTHPSFNCDANTKHSDYQRLEFIGDSIIGFTVADLIYKMYPNMLEGEMTMLRSNLVQSKNLNKLAKKFHFDKYVLLGNSIQMDQINKMSHLFEDIFEGVIGAIYLDLGFKVAYNVIKKIFYFEIQNFDFNSLINYKSQLQEQMQAEKKEMVKYEVVGTTGPTNDRIFEVTVSYDGVILGRGKGRSKKEAEQEAAKRALEKKA